MSKLITLFPSMINIPAQYPCSSGGSVGATFLGCFKVCNIQKVLLGMSKISKS